MGEALGAVDRALTTGFERNLGLVAAGSAGSGMHNALGAETAALTGETTILLFAGGAAAGAAAGLIGEAFLGVELLLRNGESELGATIAAGKGFVLVHKKTSS